MDFDDENGIHDGLFISLQLCFNFYLFLASNEKSLPKRPPPVKFIGVKEGHEFNLNTLDTHFAYGSDEIKLESNADGDMCFKDFLQNSEAKFGSAVLDKVLVYNLEKMKVVTMRPVQIATLQAVFYEPPFKALRQPDFIGVSSTGSGKTIGFLVPAIQTCLNAIKNEKSADAQRKPKILVFAHTNSLVVNIYQTARKLSYGTPLVIKFITGGKAFLRDGFFDIGICTVGRFWAQFDPAGSDAIISVNELEYLIIDEADKLADCPIFYKTIMTIKERKPVSLYHPEW